MTPTTFDTAGLHLLCARCPGSPRIAYILYPADILAPWIENASRRFHTSIIVITGMDWDNDLTPWSAKGVPAGSPDFKGLAPEFLGRLTGEVLPSVESRLAIGSPVRTLFGDSLSGLFTLWQWASCTTFLNIASLSGSFWYEGFVEWFGRQDYSGHTGKAFFLLGDKEAQSKVKAFDSVMENTTLIVNSLKRQGVATTFKIVPGNHYQFPIERLNAAFEAIYAPSTWDSSSPHPTGQLAHPHPCRSAAIK